MLVYILPILFRVSLFYTLNVSKTQRDRMGFPHRLVDTGYISNTFSAKIIPIHRISANHANLQFWEVIPKIKNGLC